MHGLRKRECGESGSPKLIAWAGLFTLRQEWGLRMRFGDHVHPGKSAVVISRDLDRTGPINNLAVTGALFFRSCSTKICVCIQ